MRIVFDLDGTLTNNDHRTHFITGETKDWDAFFEACDGDTPIWPAIETLIALTRGHDRHGYAHSIEIWSGRGEGNGGSVRSKTVRWLRYQTGAHFIIREETAHSQFFYGDPLVDLRMRSHGDFTSDDLLKRGWLADARLQGSEPQLVFDDRQKVVDMWRAEGIPCFQVAPGDF